MKTIVAASGPHPDSDRAVEWAAHVAQRTAARLIAVMVYHPAYSTLSPTAHDETVTSRRDHLRDLLAKTDLTDIEIEVTEGEAVEQLLGFSQRNSADLIVIGRHGSMAPGGFGERGAADGLLRTSRTPFAVIGTDTPIPAPDDELTFVVGVDGSDANADSVAGIANIAADLRARAVPVLAVNTGASTTRDHYGSHLIHEAEAKSIAARLPGDESLRIINESPVQGLLDEVEELDADVIAIGTRGHWSLVDLFAGHITRHVIDHASCAVLVAPHH